MNSVLEIRQKLVKLGLTEQEADEIKGKANLITKLEELEVDNESKEIFENLEVDEEEIETVKENEQEEKEIKICDPEWSDYVLSHLREDEKIKGHPKADSLRRLTELLFGSVISVTTKVVQCPSLENNGRATVVVKLKVEGYNGVYYEASGAADVYPGNTEQLFAKFPVATAETRAEGRAYRKILRLQNVVAAEELVDENEIVDPGNQITPEQKKMIDVLGERLNLNVEKFLESYDITLERFDKITETKARELCKIVNSYQETNVPENLVGYNKNWR